MKLTFIDGQQRILNVSEQEGQPEKNKTGWNKPGCADSDPFLIYGQADSIFRLQACVEDSLRGLYFMPAEKIFDIRTENYVYYLYAQRSSVRAAQCQKNSFVFLCRSRRQHA